MQHANSENSQTILTFQVLFSQMYHTSLWICFCGVKSISRIPDYFFFHYFQSTNIWKLVPKQDLKILFMTGVTCCTREHCQRWNNQMKQMKRKLWPSGKEVEKIFLKLKEKMWKGRKINLKERKQIWFKCQYLNLSQMRETE